jgi:hypothetical protein
MGRKLFVCWLFLLLASIRLFAAGTDSLQTTKKRRPHFVFNFDTRYTLLQNDPARISGLKGGLEWCDRIRTGIGFYALSTPIITKLPAAGPDVHAIEAQVKFAYAAVYGEYVFLKNEKWELSVPVQVGFGKTMNVYRDNKGEIQRTEKIPLWLVEPSVSGHYKVYSWVGLGAGAGYRQMLNDPQRETRHLNAPIYYVKVKLFAGELYRLLHKKYCPQPAA